MLPLWRLEMLGGFRLIYQNGTCVSLPTRHAEALIAYLALRNGTGHPRDQLIELLWPEYDDLDKARSRLSYNLSELHKRLKRVSLSDDRIVVSRDNLLFLDPTYVVTDVGQFEALLAKADATVSLIEKQALRMQAVACWRGELLPRLTDDWVLRERERLSNRYLDVLLELATGEEQAGNNKRALEYAHLARKADPLSEDAYAAIVRIHFEQGRFAKAAREYQILETMLRENYKESPSAALQVLWDAIPDAIRANVQREHLDTSKGKSGKTKRDASAMAFAARMPRLLTSFYGRATEIERIRQLLEENASLITLTGAGGSGKTRLAIEVAHRAQDEQGYTVFFLDLSNVTVSLPAQFNEALAGALGLTSSTQFTPLAQITDYLSRFPTLLVLDNFETCFGPATETVQALPREAPQIRLLITSRRVLNVAGEKEIVVQPLSLPGQAANKEEMLASESVQLFLDRARTVRSEFAPTDARLAVIAELCRRLEGIPLAIELAAGRMRLLSPEQILAQLEAPLETLIANGEEVSERHRTLRATLEWSCCMLPVALQRRLALLSVLQGDWTSEGAAAVWQDTSALPDLKLLRDHSLISVSIQQGEARYRMLETLREYGREKLTSKDLQEAQHRLALYYVHWAQAHTMDFEEIERDRSNLRDSLLWLQGNGRIEEALQLAIALKYFWLASRNAQYGQWWFEILLAAATELPVRLPAEVRAEAALCARLLRLPREDGIHWQISLEFGNSSANATSSNRVRWESDLADRGTDSEALQAQFTLVEGLIDPEKTAFAHYSYGRILFRQGDRIQARQKIERSLKLYRRQHHRFGVQMVLGGLGKLFLDDSDSSRAILLLTEKLELARQSGFLPEIVHALWVLGRAYQRSGDQPAADQYIEESLALCRRQGDPGRLIALLNPLGGLALERGDYPAVQALLGERLVLAQKLGSFQLQAHTLRALAEMAYSRADFAGAIAFSHRRLELSRHINDPSNEASSAADVALLHICQSEFAQAVYYLGISLDLFGEELRCHYALEVCARLAFATKEWVVAVYLFATAARLRLERLVEIPLILNIGRDPIVEKLRSELTAETFTALWKEGYTAPHTEAITAARQLLTASAR